MTTTVIVSGYFNPIHSGHVRMCETARALGDRLIVIVNNDVQQEQKKGKIIMVEGERMEVVRALRAVDEVVLAIDQDRTVCLTLEQIAQKHKGDRLIFANGGDRGSAKVVPETPVCEKHGIEMLFAVGGSDKANSSSEINKRRGEEG